MKHCYRITKYDPRFRDATGRYTLDEWTHFAQVGKRVGAHRLTMAEYLRVEALYLAALKELLVAAGTSRLQVRGLWLPSQPSPELRVWRNRHVLSVEQALVFAQLSLRERIGGQLMAPWRVYVHFGWDYYMYVGLSRNTPKALSNIRSSGLFVESASSPHEPMRPNPALQPTPPSRRG